MPTRLLSIITGYCEMKHTDDTGLQTAADDSSRQQRRVFLQSSGFVLGASLLPALAQAQTQTQSQPAAAIAELDGRTAPRHNPATEYVFTIRATIDPPLSVGTTAQGNIRAIPITGGEVSGDTIRGRVVPGGADWQRIRDDGVTELEATYAIELEDRSVVKVVNRGIIAPQPEGEPYFRTTVQFTAPDGAHAWLNEALFLCRAGLDPERENTVLIEVYKLV